jgi:RNA-directed DNA polymerase
MAWYFIAKNGGKPMNGNHSMTEKSEKLSYREKLEFQWKTIDWKKAENEVNRLQIRIAKATQKKKWNTVKRLQYLLTHSYYAKALAVRKVTTNKGRNTSGVDKELWTTTASKMRAVLSLTDKNYKSKPLRRVFIEKKGKKAKRPLGIPCMYDRAMQALYALALDPVSEVTADTKSFGFRKNRCSQDACEWIFHALSRKVSAEWVLEGDIKGCFDHISHEWLIENIPMDKSVLKQFLKAGFVFENKLFPTDDGTPQGGVISPILANMALDGMQKVLSDRFHTNRLGKVDLRFRATPHNGIKNPHSQPVSTDSVENF